MLAPGFDAPPPALKPASANAADHSHPRRRWLEQTVLIGGRSTLFRKSGAGHDRVAANLLIFLAGILPAQARLTKLVA